MSRTRIKICGITRPEDAALAVDAGVDAIGLNFVAGPRKISFRQAAKILPVIPPLVEPVGLFMFDVLENRQNDAELDEVEFSVETKQWYGKYESMAAWRWGPAGPPWWIVVPVAERKSISSIASLLTTLQFRPQAILVERASAEKLGGTGQSFNWQWLAEARAAGELEDLPPIILAGGLNPENVAEAIRIARPYAVDVSSGVEVPGRPGVKDAGRMKAFVQAVRAAG